MEDLFYYLIVLLGGLVITFTIVAATHSDSEE